MATVPMGESTAGPSTQVHNSTSQVAGDQSPQTSSRAPAPETVEQTPRQKRVRDGEHQKIGGKSKIRFPLTEGNISFYYRNYE